MHWYHSFGWTSSHVSPTVLLSKMHIGLLEIALRTSWSLSVGPSRFGRGCLLCLYLPVSMHGLLWLAEQSSLLFSCFKKQNCFSVKEGFLHTQIGCRHVLLLATNGSHFSAVLLPVFFHFSIQCFQSGPQFCGGFFLGFFFFFFFNEYFYQV